MADSQALALDTNLQNNQQSILQNRNSTLNDIETAINNAKLEGSIQGAQAQADRDQSATVTTQAQAYDNAWNLILAGVMPSADLLTAAQISTADAQAYVAKVQAQNAANGKNTDRSSNGGSYSNSGGGSGGTQHVGGSAAELPTADGGGKSAGYQQTYEAMGKAAYNIGRSQGAEAEANWIADYLDGQYDKGVITQAEQAELAQIAAKMLKLI